MSGRQVCTEAQAAIIIFSIANRAGTRAHVAASLFKLVVPRRVDEHAHCAQLAQLGNRVGVLVR